jgi:hypothetical protein
MHITQAMAKPKKPRPKLSNDVKWYRKNLKTLTPRAYFNNFSFKNRQKGHKRYKIVTDTYQNKVSRKKLQDEFNIWRSSLESQTYWLEVTRKATRNSLRLGAAERVEDAVGEEFEFMENLGSPLSSQGEAQVEDIPEEDIPEEETQEEEMQETDETPEDDLSIATLPFFSTVHDGSFSLFVSTDKHPTADSYYNCLLGDGSLTWNTNEYSASHCPDWIIDDINITSVLKKIRSSSITAAQNLERISSI